MRLDETELNASLTRLKRGDGIKTDEAMDVVIALIDLLDICRDVAAEDLTIDDLKDYLRTNH